MAEQKTAAELQAEADKAPEDEARKQQEQQYSWFGRLWNMLPDFDLGSLLMWGLVLVVAYSFGKSEKGQAWIEDMVGRFEPETQLKINGMLNAVGLGKDVGTTLTEMPFENAKTALAEQVPAEALKVVAKDKPTLDMLVKTAQAANGGKAGTDEFANDKTLFALMTQQPEFVRELATSTLKSGASTTGGMAQQILTSLKTIVADEGRLGLLLNPPHRDNTVALIQQLSPQITPKQLNTLIDTGLANGVPTPAFRSLLGGMLTGEEATMKASLDAYVKATPTAATIALELVESKAAAPTAPAPKAAKPHEKPKKATEEPLSSTDLFNAIQTNNGGKAYAALKTALGDAQAYTFLSNAENTLAFEQFSLTHREALAAFLKASDQKTLPPQVRDRVQALLDLPQDALPALAAMVGNGVSLEQLQTLIPTGSNGKPVEAKQLVAEMFDNSKRATLAQAGEENISALVQAMAQTTAEKQAAALITPHSLHTVLTAADAIAGSPAMQDKTTARDTQQVTAALVELLVNDNRTPIAQVTPEKFATFFHNATNAEAVKTLLNESKAELPQGQQATIAALLKHWDTVQEVASDKEAGAKFIRDQLASPAKAATAESCAAPREGALGYVDAAKQAISERVAGAYLRFNAGLDGTNSIGTHAAELKALKVELDAAQCAALPAVAKVAALTSR